MIVFAIPPREQLCRDAVIEFDHDRGLKPRTDYDDRRARVVRVQDAG
jgi:hypothetical protein